MKNSANFPNAQPRANFILRLVLLGGTTVIVIYGLLSAIAGVTNMLR